MSTQANKILNLPINQFSKLGCVDAYFVETELGYLLYVITATGIEGYVSTTRDLINAKVYKSLDSLIVDAKSLGFSVRLFRNK